MQQRATAHLSLSLSGSRFGCDCMSVLFGWLVLLVYGLSLADL